MQSVGASWSFPDSKRFVQGMQSQLLEWAAQANVSETRGETMSERSIAGETGMAHESVVARSDSSHSVAKGMFALISVGKSTPILLSSNHEYLQVHLERGRDLL